SRRRFVCGMGSENSPLFLARASSTKRTPQKTTMPARPAAIVGNISETPSLSRRSDVVSRAAGAANRYSELSLYVDEKARVIDGYGANVNHAVLTRNAAATGARRQRPSRRSPSPRQVFERRGSNTHGTGRRRGRAGLRFEVAGPAAETVEVEPDALNLGNAANVVGLLVRDSPSKTEPGEFRKQGIPGRRDRYVHRFRPPKCLPGEGQGGNIARARHRDRAAGNRRQLQSVRMRRSGTVTVVDAIPLDANAAKAVKGRPNRAPFRATRFDSGGRWRH